MRRLNHQNIVNLLGVAPQEDPVMIILELCPNGSLNIKLKKSPEIPVKKLVSYATDAARGMVYLSARKVSFSIKRLTVAIFAPTRYSCALLIAGNTSGYSGQELFDQ